MDHQSEGQRRYKKRGTSTSPKNRFESDAHEDNFEDFEHLAEEVLDERNVSTTFTFDQSKSILTKNDSPDVGFRYSVNPYRGCEHGCAYCYARPSHEYLGMNAGIDFESRIVVKSRAPQLLKAAIYKAGWQVEPIVMSGNTDCYQPAERRFGLTRACLEVLAEAQHPAAIITKNILLLRDLDLLTAMAKKSLVQVMITITSLDDELVRKLEPRTPTPSARLAAVRKLSDAGIPVGVMHAPLIPGLTDWEMPRLLAAAAEAGAMTAHYLLLRLPHAVRPIFFDWLALHYPDKVAKVEAMLRQVRGGEVTSSKFGERMRGTGPYAEQLATNFRVFAKKHGLYRDLPPLNVSLFHGDKVHFHQPSLFGD